MKYVHNVGKAPTSFWSPQRDKRLELLVGINKVEDSDFELFEHKIRASNFLKVSEDLSEVTSAKEDPKQKIVDKVGEPSKIVVNPNKGDDKKEEKEADKK